MVSQPPLCLDQGISDMHPGIENQMNRTRTGRPAEFLQRERPGPVLLSLGAGRVAQHVHWHERRD